MESILLAILKKFATEEFVGRFAVLILKWLSLSTKNKVDDGVCKIVGDALGQPCD